MTIQVLQDTGLQILFAFLLSVLVLLVYRWRMKNLLKTNLALEKKVQERIAAIREQAEETAVLEERYRIAQELHDSLAQSLAAMIVYMESAARWIDRSPAQATNQIKTACEIARNSLEETRRSVFALHPTLLERGDLFEALRKISHQFSAGGNLPIQCNLKGERRVLSNEVELTILRIAQEALSNARKHSEASNADLDLNYGEDFVELYIRDDGKGFDTAEIQRYSKTGFGLSGMRLRAQKIGADLAINSKLNRGTTIHLRVELEPIYANVPVAEADVMK